MTKEQAIEAARQVAIAERWSWLEPVEAVHQQRGCCWIVVTNANGRGCQARIVIDDQSGKILSRSFCPR